MSQRPSHRVPQDPAHSAPTFARHSWLKAVRSLRAMSGELPPLWFVLSLLFLFTFVGAVDPPPIHADALSPGAT